MDPIKGINYKRNSAASGFAYLGHGIKLLMQPELRIFALAPIVINILLFIGLTSMLVSYYSLGNEWLKEHTWTWLHSFLWIIGALFGFLLLFSYGYIFTMLTNIIGAPFYGFLAEKTQYFLSGEKPEPESITNMIPRVLGREITKQLYFISRGIAVLLIVIILSLTGIGGPIGTVIAALWGAWVLSVQYVDYCADNNRLSFKALREQLGQRKFSTYSFGTVVTIGSMIPLVNIFIAPAAVCGATVFWLNEVQPKRPHNE